MREDNIIKFTKVNAYMTNQNTSYTTKKGHQKGCPLSWRRKRDFRLCDLPDKMSTGHFSPTDKLLKQFSPYSNPSKTYVKQKLYSNHKDLNRVSVGGQVVIAF